MITKINYKNRVKMVMAGMFSFLLLSSSFLLSSCTEEPDGSNLFSSDQKTIAELIRDRSDLTAFYRILEKGGFDKYMGTYGEYTCFAPMNDGVNAYLIARFHLSGEEHLQVDLDGTATTWTTMKTGRSIRVGTFGEDAYNPDYVGLTSLNDISAIITGDIEAITLVAYATDKVVNPADVADLTKLDAAEIVVK